MKGPFSLWTFFGITLWIDIITHFSFRIYRMFSKYENQIVDPIQELSVIIPAHREEKNIKKTINVLYNENYPLKKVIVAGDEFSEEMGDIVAGLDFKNLHYVKCPSKSKAKKINFVVDSIPDLGKFIYIRDVRVRGKRNCIKKMMGHFENERVAAVTSYGYLKRPKNFISRAYFYGKSWINEVGRFRKNAQEARKAVFVICGASTIYRHEVLKKIPIPFGTKTEDTYHTWLLQINDYEVRVADNAAVFAPDIDGKGLEGIKNQIRQSYRWSSGTIQCLYSEKRLHKNKRLFYSTILPGFIEALMYSIPLAFLPVLFFIYPWFALGFLIGDTVFSLLGTAVLMPKEFLRTILHYPQILFFKYINSLIFLYALVKVSQEALFRKRFKWSNEWDPLPTRTRRVYVFRAVYSTTIPWLKNSIKPVLVKIREFGNRLP